MLWIVCALTPLELRKQHTRTAYRLASMGKVALKKLAHASLTDDWSCATLMCCIV
jgi:hypothetical protein